ncbi:MAG: hypothetical protein Q9169_002869 [Polycauliona sp. 2 TL-2023]
MLDSHNLALDSQKNYRQTTILLAGLSLEQRQLFQSLIESNRRLVESNERMSYEMQQMRDVVQIQLEMPPQVILQKPVTLLDACGQVSAFHLDFINCPEAFLAVLKIRFRQHGVEQRGLQMLDDSQFVLEDRRGKLDLSRPWSQILRPSQKVDMSMRVQELVTGRVKSPAVPQASSLSKTDTYLNDSLEHASTTGPSDIIDQFRRVQLLSTEHEDETESETERMPTKPNAYTAPLHKMRLSSASGNSTATGNPLTRPQSSYADLVRQALSSSQSHQLSLSQIYHAIEFMYPFYKSPTQTFGWQTRVRRTLERDPSFYKVNRNGASPVWTTESQPSVASKKSQRSRSKPIQSSAASASPLHLFDMSAALLSRVEQQQDK